MSQRLSQDSALVGAEGSPKARLSQDSALVGAEGSPKAHVSQVAVLVAIDTAINPSSITPIIFCST